MDRRPSTSAPLYLVRKQQQQQQQQHSDAQRNTLMHSAPASESGEAQRNNHTYVALQFANRLAAVHTSHQVGCCCAQQPSYLYKKLQRHFNSYAIAHWIMR
jgi:hypothetical protein